MRRPLLAFAAFVSAAPAPAQQQSLLPVTPAEVADAVRQAQPQLPFRADSITTVTGIRAEGTEFVYDMAIDEAVPADAAVQVSETVQSENQRRLCADPGIAEFIRRGGGMRHIYTDVTGRRFETLISRCPGAPSSST